MIESLLMLTNHSKYFPNAEGHDKAEGEKATSETKTATQSTTQQGESVSSLEKKLPDPPQEEPEAKKLKSSHEQTADTTDDDWEKIEKDSCLIVSPSKTLRTRARAKEHRVVGSNGEHDME